LPPERRSHKNGQGHTEQCNNKGDVPRDPAHRNNIRMFKENGARHGRRSRPFWQYKSCRPQLVDVQAKSLSGKGLSRLSAAPWCAYDGAEK
jgi:hypothetical protein